MTRAITLPVMYSSRKLFVSFSGELLGQLLKQLLYLTERVIVRVIVGFKKRNLFNFENYQQSPEQ